MTSTTFEDRGDRIEITTEDTITKIKKGPIGRFCSVVRHNPFRSLLAIAATGGAGYLAYDAVRSGRAKAAANHVADAASSAARLA